jgi:AraC-like DNA-binding protein
MKSNRETIPRGEGDAARLFSPLLDRVADVTGAVLNFEDLTGITHRLPELRLRPDQYIHHGPYCLHAKQHGMAQSCSRNKDRSKEIAKARMDPFCGTCPFGIWDLAWPIRDGESLVGILYGGSWRGEKDLEGIRGRAYTAKPIPRHSTEKEAVLRRWLAFIAAYLELALSRAKLAGLWPGKRRPAAWYLAATRDAIRAGYTQEISLASVAALLGVNAHHLGQLIKQEGGSTFRGLLLEQRLSAAKEMLLQKIPVNQVAAACGFADPNYFSARFTRSTGVSPRRWGRNPE